MSQQAIQKTFYGGGALSPYADRPEYEGLSPLENLTAQMDRFGEVGGIGGLERMSGSTSIVETKRAYEIVPVGVRGRPLYPPTSIERLALWRRRNSLVYACINKIAQAAIDPQLIVQKKQGKEWKEVEGHPLRRLMRRPNPLDDGPSFMRAWLVSENLAGVFYAEKVYENGMLKQLWPLNPAKVKPIPGTGPNGSPIQGYEWKDGPDKVVFKPEELMVRRNFDLMSRFHGLSPMEACSGDADMDSAQTDYVRAFFNNGGVPSGVLTFKNKTLKTHEMEQKRQAWMLRYGRAGAGMRGIAVLDQNAEYNKIGSDIKEMESEVLRGMSESRICMAFGVPPILVGAYVGLKNVNQRASVKEAIQDFWGATMSPTFAAIRLFMDWNVLIEYESEDAILGDVVRAFWDMENVVALHEDTDKAQDRERKNFQAGGITQNEFRESIGKPPTPEGDFFLIPSSVNPQTGEVLLARAEVKPAAPAPPTPPGDGNDPTREEDAQDDDTQDAGKGGNVFAELKRKAARLAPAREEKVFQLGDLTLARAPVGVETVIDLKAIATGPKPMAADIKAILLHLRKTLIVQAAKELAGRDPADLHKIVLIPEAKTFKTVRACLDKAYKRGRVLVDREAQAQTGQKARIGLDGNESFITMTKAAEVDTEDDDDLETLSNATVSRVVNDVQGKAAAVLATLAVLRVGADELEGRIKSNLEQGSTSYVEQAASAVANAAMSMGRDAEIEARSDDWGKVIYSAILDANTCETCESDDGAEAQSVEELPPAPNDLCLGGDKCRCFHVAVFERPDE